MSLAIGIDLGTTNSRAAWYEDGQVHTIENEEHEPLTSSFVYYDETETIVGKLADQRSAINPSNGIFDSKRMLGHKFDDEEIQKNLSTWPFTVTKADNGESQIAIQQKRGISNIRPEEVSAEILKKLRKSACIKLNEDIVNAVVTVPGYFSNAQRQATKDAATLAGLNVLQLINEPTAAALAFIEKNKDLDYRTVLVYGLGGGSFDASVIRLYKDNNWRVEVLSKSGDTHLGGRDFDNNLSSYCLKEIMKKYNINAIVDNSVNKRRNSRRVRTLCEQVKKTLSDRSKATLVMEQFLGYDIEITITREEFEKLNEALFQRTLKMIYEALKSANVRKDEIDDVVLVGGSTKIPKIQQLVEDYFVGKSLNTSVHPDEAVARGAAIQAALLSDSPLQKINHSLTDVTSFSLGVAQFEVLFSVIIKKNTKIPVSLERKYYTTSANQTSLRISVYEGEGSLVSDNSLLGEFDVKGITPKPKGEVRIDVRFGVDSSRILSVKARESFKDFSKDLNVVFNK